MATTKSQEALSVSVALAQAKTSLESLWVRIIGEVSELSNKAGYKAVYFTVKDAKSALPCMMWLNRYDASGVELKVGMLVEITGRFTLYAAKGRMSFDVSELAIAGEGDLRLKVANLAKKLQLEGLMDPHRKKQIPTFPQSIGLITSPRGAAVHDVLRTLRRRFPLAQIKLAGVTVEGETAPQGMIVAMQTLEQAQVEVILLVRGGGSYEDLMPFNDEGLARAIAMSPIPIVTGIGHEPDTHIADMVADFRASTPTAAAEAVSPSDEQLDNQLELMGVRLARALGSKLESGIAALDNVASRPIFSDPNMLFASDALTLDLLGERLERSLRQGVERDRTQLDRHQERLLNIGSTFLNRFDNQCALKAARLHDLSPLMVLSRGFALTKTNEGAIIKSVEAVKKDDLIKVDLSDGYLECVVNEVISAEQSLKGLDNE